MFGGSMMNSMNSMMMSQMHQMHSSSSMMGGFDNHHHHDQMLMGGGGGGMSSSHSSSRRGGGGGGQQHQSVSTSTRTSIVNGVRTTVRERTIVHPDGRVERHVENVEGDGSDANKRISSGTSSHPALDYGARRRSRR